MIDRYRQSAAKVRHAAGDTTPPKLIPQIIHDNLSEAVGTSLQNANDAGGDSTLRRSTVVDREVLLQHIGFLGGESESFGACRAIQAMHNQLIFHTEHDNPVPDGKIQLSTPPGLRNLGATCYLNSQLQCLAQNLGFVRGLFSWTKPPVDTGSPVEKRMAEVLSKMQNVLARMRYGPDRVICTNEFAAALSLENDEMQDPNEVSLPLGQICLNLHAQSLTLSLSSFSSPAYCSIECRSLLDNRLPCRSNRCRAALATCFPQCLAVPLPMSPNVLSAAISQSGERSLWT